MSIAFTKTLAIDLRWIDSSGVGTYIQGIMPGLVERLRDVAITGIGDRARLEMFAWAAASNVNLVECRAARYSLREQIELPRAIPHGADLFFSPYYTIPLLYRGPLAVTVHDMSHRIVPEIIGNTKKRLYAQLMFHELRRRAALILTVSHFSKAELLRLTRTPRGIPSNANIVPTQLGVAEEWYAAAALPSSHVRPYFVAVGNVKPYKNLSRLIDAFLRVRDRLPHDLVIVGQSEGLVTGESAAFFAKVRGAGERIRLTGFVSHQELLSLVGHAHALVMPSLYEGFGLPPLEAMAAGTPVIVAKAASLPEVCGESALYFDPLQTEDIAAKLVASAQQSQEQRLQQVAQGIAQSRRFTWESCAQLTADALRATLGSQS